ncbi:M56 family metallopeptidase [Paenibacillaceae bacterium WGS1546]|uniref:M56 family metallopeptidase n=1 Tax=Cohnella sp. WGS1546 TaxID=3366810 RepID=UPI00372D1B11
MTGFLFALLAASFAGTIAWIAQTVLKPLTQRGFSQTWHYYSAFIPVFFLLGGSEIVNRLMPALRSVLPGSGNGALSGTIAGSNANILPAAQEAARSPFANSLADYVMRFEIRREWILLAFVLWVAGAFIYLAVHVRSYRRFRRSLLRESRLRDIAGCPVKVIESARATTPMLVGLWKPMIVLPQAPLGERELVWILSHELVHYKRGDLFVKLLAFAANAVHWFNPAAYAINKRIHMLCELSCDEKVVCNLDMESRRKYGETLLSVLEYGAMKRNVICTNGLCNPKRDMKRRLMNLMTNRKNTRKSVLALSLVATIAIAGSGAVAAQSAGSAVPPKAESPKPTIPTKLEKPIEGRNITVQYADGTIESFDKNGNRVPGRPKEGAIRKMTNEEIVERIVKHIEKGLPVPELYVDALPQKEIDALNEAYGIELHGSK